MKRIGMTLAVLAGVVALTSSANAASSDCSSIADPMKRLACYDKATHAAARSAKPAAGDPVWDTAWDAVPAKALAKALPPVKSAPRSWFEVDAGFYGSLRNVPGEAPTGFPITTAPIPSSPGFIGSYQQSSVINPTLDLFPTPISYGGGVNYQWGYWLNPQQTLAVEGSGFFGLSHANPSSGQAITTNFVNTTPDVFVGLFTDNTTVSTGGIWDVFYGADANYRMTLPHYLAPNVTKLDVLVGLRYVGLDEFSTSSSSVLTRTYQPALGLPPPDNSPFVDSSRPRFLSVWNNFIGPQAGFNVEQHWGPYWVESENKMAVGVTIEPTWSGPTSFSISPKQQVFLAGIPLTVNAGGPSTTVFDRNINTGVKWAFSFVPSGTFKIGYDLIPDQRSLYLAYNYLYMSSVGLIAYEFPNPGIKQASFFQQGITVGFKEKF